MSHVDNQYQNSYDEQFKKEAREHIEEYAQAHLPAVPHSGKHSYVCPCCNSGVGNNNHFTAGFNIFRFKGGELGFHCLACGESGDIFKLAGIVEGLKTFPEKLEAVARFLNVDIVHRAPIDHIRKKVAFNPVANAAEEKRLKEEAQKYIEECEENIGLTDYFQGRGFSEKTIKEYRLGYDPKKHMAVIPFTRGYYIGRNIKVGANVKAAYKHYSPKGITKPVFNAAALGTQKNPEKMPVFVCEAPMDALSVIEAGGHAVAVAGTAFSMFCRIIKTYQPDVTFVLAFDNDQPGQVSQLKLARDLDDLGVDVRYIHASALGAFGRFNDANEALLADRHDLEQTVQEFISKVKAFEENKDPYYVGKATVLYSDKEEGFRNFCKNFAVKRDFHTKFSRDDEGKIVCETADAKGTGIVELEVTSWQEAFESVCAPKLLKWDQYDETREEFLVSILSPVNLDFLYSIYQTDNVVSAVCKAAGINEKALVNKEITEKPVVDASESVAMTEGTVSLKSDLETRSDKTVGGASAEKSAGSETVSLESVKSPAASSGYKGKVWLDYPAAFIKENLKSSYDSKTYHRVTLPKGTVIDGKDVSYYRFSPLYVNPCKKYGDKWRTIPLLADREVWLSKGFGEAKDTVVTSPIKLKEALEGFIKIELDRSNKSEVSVKEKTENTGSFEVGSINGIEKEIVSMSDGYPNGVFEKEFEKLCQNYSKNAGFDSSFSRNAEGTVFLVDDPETTFDSWKEAFETYCAVVLLEISALEDGDIFAGRVLGEDGRAFLATAYGGDCVVESLYLACKDCLTDETKSMIAGSGHKHIMGMAKNGIACAKDYVPEVPSRDRAESFVH